MILARAYTHTLFIHVLCSRAPSVFGQDLNHVFLMLAVFFFIVHRHFHVIALLLVGTTKMSHYIFTILRAFLADFIFRYHISFFFLSLHILLYLYM